MLAKILGYLVLIGIGHMPFLHVRHQRFVAMLGVLAVGAILGLLYYQMPEAQRYAFEWINVRNYRLKISVDTTADNLLLIAPFMGIMLLMMICNVFYIHEVNKVKINTLVICGGINLIFLICSQNIIQLMITAIFSTVLGYAIINDVYARRKFVFYNLVADMALFMLIALLRAQAHSVNIETIALLSNTFKYKDVLVGSLMIFVFVKAGLFSFQSALLDLHNIRHNRRMAAAYLTTPMAAVLTLYKLRFMLDMTSGAQMVIYVMAVATVIWSVVMLMMSRKDMYVSIVCCALLCSVIASPYLSLDNVIYVVVCGFALNLVAAWLLSENNAKDNEFFYQLYNHAVVMPIKVVGKVLLITIDFLFIERTIMASIAKFDKYAVLSFQKLHVSSILGYALFGALGLVVMFYCFGVF